jgi:dTMP kinase
VYQGIARGLGIDVVRRLQQAALGDFAPDLTVILDLDPMQGLQRAAGRSAQHIDESRFERFDVEFHARLREGFRALATREPQRCVLVDASRPTELVAADIWSAVSERIAP